MPGCWHKFDAMLAVSTLLVLPMLFTVAKGRSISHGSTNGLLSMLDYATVLQKREQQDQSFQQAAFQAFGRHKTGQIYNVSSSGNFVVQAVRFRSRSLRKYGFVLNEFEIPPGCQVESSSERVLLVYESLGKSDLFLVDGYVLVAPVVGISIYDASNLSTAEPVPKLSLIATGKNITVHLPVYQPLANMSPLCAYFEENSLSVVVSNLTPSGICSVSYLGFLSLVAKYSAPTPATTLTPTDSLSSSPLNPPSTRSKTWKVAVGAVAGALAVLAFFCIVASASLKRRRYQKLAMMEHQADSGETLQTYLIRNTRAPAAGALRTKPTLESEYLS